MRYPHAEESFPVEGLDDGFGKLTETFTFFSVAVRNICNIWMVQYFDCIHPHLELFRLRKLEALDQIHVETEIARPFDPHLPKIPERSRLRILEQNISL